MRAHSLLQLKRNPNFPSQYKRRPLSPNDLEWNPTDSAATKKNTEFPLSSR